VRALAVGLVCFFTLTLASCGRSAPAAPADAGADGGADGQCALDPTGSFVFHVHNAGTTMLVLDLGCGKTLPVVLATPAGRLPIGPGGVDTCEFTCDQIYSGHNTPGGCTDCGPGVSKTLAPDGTVDVPWDRRVYERHTLAPPCSTATGTCALGTAVAQNAMQLGAVTACPSDKSMPFACTAPLTTEFTVDTTGAEATIDVGL
jgi:hypothetical protein